MPHVEEQLLVNPVLEHSTTGVSDEDAREDREESFRDAQNQEKSSSDTSQEDFDWKDVSAERQYDDISYRRRIHSG